MTNELEVSEPVNTEGECDRQSEAESSITLTLTVTVNESFDHSLTHSVRVISQSVK